MKQVAPIELDQAQGQPSWLPIVLAGAVFLSAAALSGGAIALLWAAGAALRAPLTLLAAGALFLLPGLALLRWLWPAPLTGAERLALATGLSCALPPFLLLLSEPLGFHWSGWIAWSVLALSAAALAWPRSHRQQPRLQWRFDRTLWLLLLLTGAALAVRLYVTRDLPVGLWGDSYHHTVIAQLLVDNGGLFRSWQPYVPLTTFTYHFGFHSLVAWLHWLSGLPVTTSLFVVGQILDALAIPGAFLLARRLFGDDRTALWAALFTGFLSVLPAYYVNWGRYTQLAGQIVLPAVAVSWMALIHVLTDRPLSRSRLVRLALLTAVTTAGLLLTHYRVAVFAACFVAAYALVLTAVQVRSLPQLAWLVGGGLVTTTLAVALSATWLLRIREGALLRIGQHFASQNIGADQTNALPPSTAVFDMFLPPVLLSLAVLGLLALLWQRRWQALVLPLWVGLVVLAANPYLLGLTGAGIITNFAVLLANYLVLAPLAGAAVAAAAILARRRLAPVVVNRSLLVAGALLVAWASGWQSRIVEPPFQIFTPADARAVEWIERELSPDSAIFVNSATAYVGTLYVGTDGGWWLSFLTGRATNLPPIVYGSEAAAHPDFQRQVNNLNATIQELPLDSPAAAAALQAAGFDYLYNGPAANPPAEYVDATLLAQSPYYELVYEAGGVTIWRIR